MANALFCPRSTYLALDLIAVLAFFGTTWHSNNACGKNKCCINVVTKQKTRLGTRSTQFPQHYKTREKTSSVLVARSQEHLLSNYCQNNKTPGPLHTQPMVKNVKKRGYQSFSPFFSVSQPQLTSLLLPKPKMIVRNDELHRLGSKFLLPERESFPPFWLGFQTKRKLFPKGILLSVLPVVLVE